MKIQCDVCEKATATVICGADEAALCSKCDIEVHAANKLASKHQRLLLQTLSDKLPHCDICQEKAAFIFCVEDRALFCKECDEPIHSVNSLAANHQRFLATGIRVALSSSCKKDPPKGHLQDSQPPKPASKQIAAKSSSQQVSAFSSASWSVDELIGFSDYNPPEKKFLQEQQLELDELEWLTNMGLFREHEVPQLSARPPPPPPPPSSNMNTNKSAKFYMPQKRARMDDHDFFTVPDLG
ncbi:unnamed protein product [Cuscuta campestris]|uniref:B box-type domain-containing protein n=1 Tax=Cuscuta campestris TaxID=132261 RepID=A0A484MWJ6_9ASTE|nr:unnamed protein product [Cuscuta campestris]